MCLRCHRRPRHGAPGDSAMGCHRSPPRQSGAPEALAHVIWIVNSHAQGDVGPPGTALDLHVLGWRRFPELPMDHMLATTPDIAQGRFRVAFLPG